MSEQIRFLCPTCRAIMEAPIAQAGNKISCLKCGQRLQIPPAERAKTILAPMVPTAAQPTVHVGVATSARAASPAATAGIPVATYASPPAPAPTSARRGRGCLLTATLLFAAGLTALACMVPLTWYGWTYIRGSAAVDVAEKRQEPRLPEERLVKKYILDNAHDPKSVEFDRWGPHILKDAYWGPSSRAYLLMAPLAQALGQGKGNSLEQAVSQTEPGPAIGRPNRVRTPAKLIRVCYRGPNARGAKTFSDEVFVIQDGKVSEHWPNMWGGDEWTKPLADKAKPSSKKNGKETDSPQFDPNNLDRTVSWAFATSKSCAPIVNNKIALDDKIKKLKAECGQYVGKRVRWSMKVGQVTDTHVEFMASWPDPQLVSEVLTLEPPSEPSPDDAVLALGLRPSRPLRLAVGEGISRDRASQLQPNSAVTVKGTVHNITAMPQQLFSDGVHVIRIVVQIDNLTVE